VARAPRDYRSWLAVSCLACCASWLFGLTCSVGCRLLRPPQAAQYTVVCSLCALVANGDDARWPGRSHERCSV
jgi:hypothetical protein